MDKKPLIAFGWLRALIFLLFIIPATIGSWWLGEYLVEKIAIAKEPLYVLMVIHAVVFIVAFLLVFLFVKFIDKKTLESLGFAWKGFKNDAGTGFFTAILILAIGTLIIIASGYLKFTGIVMMPQKLFISLVLFAIVAFSEELIFRGYVLNNLMQSLKPWLALTVSSLLFGLFHIENPNAGLFPILNVIAGGFLLGINYVYTRNLWFGIFLHFSWNFFQGPVFGFEVSGFDAGGVFVQSMDGPAWLTGNGFGFEGSAVGLLLIILAVLFLNSYYNKRVAEIKTSI